MSTFNVHEAKTQLSRLLERAQAGEEIILAKAGKPVAKLVPLPRAGQRMPGQYPMEIPGSLFDALPDAELAAWER